MLAGVITGDLELAKKFGQREQGLDLLEFRLDHFAERSLDVLRGVLAGVEVPALFTLRSRSQGGQFGGSETERLVELMQLAEIGPRYVDLEHDVDPAWIRAFQKKHPKIGVVLSYHDFERTPEDLEAVLAQMRGAASAEIYKIATHARTTVDALRLLCFTKKHGTADDLACMAMGADGVTTRVLGHVMGSQISYCGLGGTTSAPGQLSVEEMLGTYGYRRLNRETKIYGLLGNPVEQSVGHIFHNRQFERLGKNAVYVKWRLTPEELDAAVPLLREMGVAGLSVTMPLKEPLMRFIEPDDADVKVIGAANTVVVEDGVWRGLNTDGRGAMAALGMPLQNKTVVVLGAGGAARAIVYTAVKQGARVIILNRSIEKAEKIAAGLGSVVSVQPLTALGTAADLNYDALIDTLPSDVAPPLGEQSFIHGAVVMNINYYAKSDLLRRAAEAGCRCVDGRGMYEMQAVLQLRRWFNDDSIEARRS